MTINWTWTLYYGRRTKIILINALWSIRSVKKKVKSHGGRTDEGLRIMQIPKNNKQDSSFLSLAPNRHLFKACVFCPASSKGRIVFEIRSSQKIGGKKLKIRVSKTYVSRKTKRKSSSSTVGRDSRRGRNTRTPHEPVPSSDSTACVLSGGVYKGLAGRRGWVRRLHVCALLLCGCAWAISSFVGGSQQAVSQSPS